MERMEQTRACKHLTRDSAFALHRLLQVPLGVAPANTHDRRGLNPSDHETGGEREEVDHSTVGDRARMDAAHVVR